MVVASEKSEFGQPEIDVGVYPPVAVILFPRLVGRMKALELILTGKRIGAKEAERIGLVNRVVPADRLEEEVTKLVGKLTEKSPIVLGLTKRALYRGLDMELKKALENVNDSYLGLLMHTEDAVEGLKAFLEKRKPKWKGK
jgi:cyclohexa-1,5-dienecarbonyl-CoA hydratase